MLNIEAALYIVLIIRVKNNPLNQSEQRFHINTYKQFGQYRLSLILLSILSRFILAQHNSFSKQFSEALELAICQERET